MPRMFTPDKLAVEATREIARLLDTSLVPFSAEMRRRDPMTGDELMSEVMAYFAGLAAETSNPHAMTAVLYGSLNLPDWDEIASLLWPKEA